MAFGKFDHLSRKPSGRPDTQTAQKPVVLAVDDDKRIIQGLELNLQKHYTVRTCTNAKDVMKCVDEELRVVILDIKMPGKSGLEVYKEIKASLPELPIIFYSAYQNALEGVKLKQEYQPFNYFNKSGNIQELLESVERAVKHYENILSMSKISDRLKGFGKK